MYNYLRCSTKLSRGTAIKLRNGNIIPRRRHSDICNEKKDAQDIADFKAALKSALERSYWKLKNLYKTTAALYPRRIKQLVPYSSVLDSMKRWRRCDYPPNPRTLEEMAEQLENPNTERLRSYDLGTLACRRIIDANQKLHLLIYDRQSVGTEFIGVKRIFVDGTFQTTPQIRGVYQVVTILGVIQGHALPFVHILMSSKTQVGYMAVLREISAIIDGTQVKVVMSDFELGLRNACRDVFVYAHVTGCSVHYDRALLKKIKTSQLTTLLRDNDDAKIFLKSIMALAYLPQEMIATEFERLKSTLRMALKTRLNPFLAYYDRQWLRIVKPSGFSVFGLARRTNNVVECYNSVLADELGVHPSGWTFVAKLVKLTSNARDDLVSLKRGTRISRHPRYETIFRKTQLVQAWKDLYSGEIDPKEFIERTANLKGHIRELLNKIPDEGLDNEEEMENTPDNPR